MVKSPPASAPPRNHLLARLPKKDYERLLPLMRSVPLEFMHILNEPRSHVNCVYFPTKGVVSAVTLMNDGSSIEVATIGNEGMVGLPAFLNHGESPNRMIVQVEGDAFRMETAVLQAETKDGSPLRHLLVTYQTAFSYQVSQSVACNGLHTVQPRCCRWILMTHDRALADEFPLTHEFLAHMLGVRRVSVTEVLKPLQDAGLIRNHRGRITVLNRQGLEDAACECYSSVKAEFDRLFGKAAI